MGKSIKLATPLTIGIDVSDRRSHACVLDAGGGVCERRSFATTRPAVQRALGPLPPSRVVLEVGTHSPWLSRELEGLGHEVLVANARELRSISRSDRKSDASDAEQLARLGRADPRLLRPIRHRSEQTQRDRARLGVRDGLVRARTSLINQARGLAKALGVRLPSCGADGFARRMQRDQLTQLFPGLDTLVEMIERLTAAIGVQDRAIETLCTERYPQTALLRQVAGVGPITALAYVLTIEDPARFRRSRAVGSYLGLRPRQRDSGESHPELRISKAGDPYLRRTLVQAAHYILGPFGPDTDLRRFGQRVAARGGRAARKKARVAVARKLAVLLHRLWMSAEVYEPQRAPTA
jgi:transposase